MVNEHVRMANTTHGLNTPSTVVNVIIKHADAFT